MTTALPERRQDPNNQAVLEYLRELADQMSHLRAEVQEVKRTHQFSNAITTEMIEKAVSKSMAAAFPEGDPDGHRISHELAIATARSRADLYEALKKEVAKYGILGLLGWAGVAIWHAFLQGPK